MTPSPLKPFDLSGLQSENFVSFRDARSEAFAEQLKLAALRDRGHLLPAKVGSFGLQTLQPSIRGDSIGWIVRGAIPILDAELELLRQQLNEEFFLGLADWECHFALYPRGGLYQRHVDQSVTVGDSERVVSFVLYLNRDWPPESGGQLVIFENSADQVGQRTEPQMGRWVLFLSQSTEHEVIPARQERWSLTGWFLRRTLKPS